jgi:hypothetical protein
VGVWTGAFGKTVPLIQLLDHRNREEKDRGGLVWHLNTQLCVEFSYVLPLELFKMVEYELQFKPFQFFAPYSWYQHVCIYGTNMCVYMVCSQYSSNIPAPNASQYPPNPTCLTPPRRPPHMGLVGCGGALEGCGIRKNIVSIKPDLRTTCPTLLPYANRGKT